jgi:hypothetical protein
MIREREGWKENIEYRIMNVELRMLKRGTRKDLSVVRVCRGAQRKVHRAWRKEQLTTDNRQTKWALYSYT